MLRRGLPLALAAVLAAVAPGCGGEDGPTSQQTSAETEGLYLETGGLTYQISISRQLNPSAVEDRDYLRGLPPGTPPLRRDESWYAVFLRVKNEGERPKAMAREFMVRDTQDDEYRPVPVDARNPFAYKPLVLPPRATFPDQSSNAGLGPINGGMVLFRLKTDTLYNRPLEFVLRGAEPGSTEIDYQLDV